jgi:hypothetical protein
VTLRINQVLPLLVISIVLVAVGLTFFAPIFEDEISYKMFLERFFITGGFQQTLMPFCSDGFMVRPGALLIPAATFWSIISWFGSSWLSYRIIPYLCLLTIYIGLIVHNVRKGERDFWPLLLLMTLGPVLYGLVMLRAEILILSFGMMLYVLARYMLSARSGIWLCIYSSAMLLLFSLITYVHPKALYLSAIVVFSFVMAAANLKSGFCRLIYRGVFVIGAVLIIHTSIDLFKTDFLAWKCVPVFERWLGKQSVNPMDIFTARDEFREDVKLAVFAHISPNTFTRTRFEKSYDINFLPDKESTNGFDALANVLIEATIIFFITYIILKTIACIRFLKDEGERKQFYLVVSVMLSLFIPFLLNIAGHFYEVSFFVCALMISAGLLWPFKASFLWPLKMDKTKKKQFFVTSSIMILLSVPVIGYFLYVFVTRGTVSNNFSSEISFLLFGLMILAASLLPFEAKLSEQSEISGHSKYRSCLSLAFYVYMMITAVLCVTLDYCNFTKAFIGGYEGYAEGGGQSFIAVDRIALEKRIQQALSDASISETEPMIMDDLTYDAVRKHPIVMSVNFLKVVSPSELKLCLDKYHVRYGVLEASRFELFKTKISLEPLTTIQFAKQWYKQPLGTDIVYLFKVKE